MIANLRMQMKGFPQAKVGWCHVNRQCTVSDPDNLNDDQFVDQVGFFFAETSDSRLLTEM